MEMLTDFQLSKEIETRIRAFDEEIRAFGAEGPLDPVAIKKLQEFFRVQHIFHSTGIEGNRLSIRETEMVLIEGIELEDRPLGDQQEVKDLDAALRHLHDLAKESSPVREIDLRELHRLAVRNRPDAEPGTYRKIGVVITGSEHRPPEPIAVPGLIQKAIEWLNASASKLPLIGSAYVHHQIAYIHPFLDGNGRTARLLMNLVLLRAGYPIVNIKRDDRPKYYEALSFADVGLYEPLLELILERAIEVFSEMKRVREETERMRKYAEIWGQTEAALIHRREEREYKLWLGQMQSVRNEFEYLADALDEKLKEIDIRFQRYPDPDLSKYIELRDKGKTQQNWFFRIRFGHETTGVSENFMFNFYRDFSIFGSKSSVIPLNLNRAAEDGIYAYVDTPKIRLRQIFFDNNELLLRLYHPDGKGGITQTSKLSPAQVGQEFFTDVLKECFGLKHY